MSTVKEATMEKPATATAPEPVTESATKPANSLFTEAVNLFAEFDNLHNSIANRAFEIFKDRGSVPGLELDDWFKAESELLKFTPVEVKDLGDNLEVTMEAPGFTAEELKVSIEPNRLIISGKSEKKEEKKEAEKVSYTEQHANRIYRSMSLPTEVVTDKATAIFKDGVLTLTLPKATKNSKVEVEVK